VSQILRDAETRFDRTQQRIVIVGRRVGCVTRAVIGGHDGRYPAAARTRPAIAATSQRMGVVALVVVFVEGDDDRVVAWLLPRGRVHDAADDPGNGAVG